MQNKTVLITGATSGIGYETALQLARKGAKIVLTCRDEARGIETADRIRGLSGNLRVYPMYCRLDSFRSIADFCFRFCEEHPQLHVLINNAGIWETTFRESVDGIEMTWAVNFLAPFLMTNLLARHLIKSAPARIINVSSEAHQGVTIDFEDPECRRKFSWMKPYRQSKLADILFTRLLAEKLKGSGITANCLHPGVVMTSIFRNMNPVLRVFFRIYMIPPEKGAKTSVYLASSPEVEGITGVYFKKCEPAKGSDPSADMKLAEQLWSLALQYTRPCLPEPL